MTKSIIDMTSEEFASLLKAQSPAGPAFRANQILEWVWKNGVSDFDSMTNIPAQLRIELGDCLSVCTTSIADQKLTSDGVVKLAVRLSDGEVIETVMIPSGSRRTACISTQAGCAMGCVFCASGLDGFRRDLTSGEMLEQILLLQRHCGEKISHVVFMGMGEPLANFNATARAISAIVDPRRLGISARRVTVSTVGIPEKIILLSKIPSPVTLAISLHAPTDELRNKLIPTSKNYPIRDILDAARIFFSARKREVTLEYILLSGVNDTKQCATNLARIASNLRCNINLIRYNLIETLEFKSPSIDSVNDFADYLKRLGVNVQIRQSRGLDADAACGQLRRRQ